jgi:hypothetical protein
LYLYGVILRERNKKPEAIEVLLKSLNKAPLLWSAWLELGQLIDKKNNREIFDSLKPHWVHNFYYANYFLEIH